MSEAFVSRRTEPMTWTQLVQAWCPWADDGEAGRILWNATAFPFADSEHTERQIAEFAADPDWDRVYREMDEAMDAAAAAVSRDAEAGP